MLLVQDQYVQNSRKNFDTESQLKQNGSKPVFSDSKEIWEIESGEEVITSGNDSEPDENFFFGDPSDLREEAFEDRRAINSRKKNVRFGSSDFNYVFETSETSSLDNEYFGDCGGHLDGGRRRSLSLSQDREAGKEFRPNHKPKWRSLDCEHDKRPKSSPEYPESVEKRAVGLGECTRRLKRKEHRCGRHHYEAFDDVVYRTPTHRLKYSGCGGDITSGCCEYCTEKKSYFKMTPNHRHVYHGMKGSESEMKIFRRSHHDTHHAPTERYCLEEYCDHGYASRMKKKTLEAVQEQQEQLSDSTYKVPCSKFSSQTIPGELSVLQKKRSTEKLTSCSDWLYCGTRENGNSLGGKLAPPRIHKLRSRRTRMNRIKNGWKKALVQTVRDGSRNERVGVIVMGSKGPEFYSKNSKKPTGFVPFRKSKSFLDGPAKSFEVMTVDCKNVFLSSSEPGPRTNYINDLVCPEEDDKVEEKMARFSKNVNEIVKNSEEKFYKALSSSDYLENKHKTKGMFKGAGEGVPEEESNVSNLEEKKEEIENPTFSSFPSLPFETFSPRVLKSFRKPERRINEESKAIADALNEQAKQYLESQSSSKEKDKLLEELKEKYPPKEMSPETIDANLSLWGMKVMAEKQETGKEEKSEEKREEMSQTGSVKSTEQISLNKQRRKKYYETTAGGKLEDDDDVISSKPQSDVGTPTRSGRGKKWELPEGTKSPSNPNSKLISEVFRDLVENGCAISREESENLQSILNQEAYNPELMSSSSSDVINTIREGKAKSPKTPMSLEVSKGSGEKKEEKKGRNERVRESGDSEGFLEDPGSRKVLKINCLEEKALKKMQGKNREGKAKKKMVLEDRMKLLREALPSIAAENEAAHLKQLKKYIDRFIDRVEASTTTEFDKRKEGIRGKSKEYASTDSSEVRVDARKILDFVSNPFKKISSDVTINIAKKLTDALVFEGSKNFSTSNKARKHSENETNDDAFDASSGSERCEEPEPTYLRQLKKMRNEHLNNIVLEVKRLSELLRFLDRCNRLHF